MHISHPAFARHTACGRDFYATTLRVTFGGPTVSCEVCRTVMLRLLGVQTRRAA